MNFLELPRALETYKTVACSCSDKNVSSYFEYPLKISPYLLDFQEARTQPVSSFSSPYKPISELFGISKTHFRTGVMQMFYNFFFLTRVSQNQKFLPLLSLHELDKSRCFYCLARGQEVYSVDQRKPLLKKIPNAARARLARGFIKEIPYKMQHVQDQPRGVLSYIFVVKNQLFRNSLNMAFSQFSPKK